MIFLNGYQRISRCRSELLGMAILMVVYGHLLYYHSGLENYEDLNFTEWYTLESVEMFMFISGFGVYQSLRKDRDAVSFYRRRLGKLLPAFLPVMAVWCVFGMAFRGMRPEQAMGNLTGLGWWFGQKNQFNWYVPAMIVLYLLSPLFYDCLERSKRQGLWVFAALFAVIVAGWRTNLLMSLTRFPTYYLGMYVGKQYAGGRSPSKRQLLVWTVVGVISLGLVVPFFFLVKTRYLWYYGMYWLPFFAAAPLTMFGLSKLVELQEKNAPGRLLNRFWRFFGDRSFEIYLCHLAFYEMCLSLGLRGWPKWILAAVLGTGIGALYHQVLQRLQKLHRQKKLRA